MMRNVFIDLQAFVLLVFPLAVMAQRHGKPEHLTVNLLSRAGQVYQNGYPVNAGLAEAENSKGNFQFAEINPERPFFGWVVPSSADNTFQTAFRLLVSSDAEKCREATGDMWDSGRAEGSASVNVVYGGRPLEPGKVYHWRVKTWDNHGRESAWSDIMGFGTAAEPGALATAVCPLQKQDESPVEVRRVDSSTHFADFGKAAFGRIRISLDGKRGGDTVKIHLGEAVKEGRLDRSPGGTIRYSVHNLALLPGWNTYVVAIPPDKRNTGPQAIPMPQYTGEVTPFRYCELENYPARVNLQQLTRETVFYPFDETSSSFHSSDTVLNRVWEMCKYTIKVTSFAGIYVDGDRERIPYEADALINQLCHYGVDREYSMARRTLEYLIFHPTWPTEWILQTVLMAWEDYLYTGNSDLLLKHYDDLKAKTLVALADEEGFISTRTSRITPEILRSVHFNGDLRDIVDWPHSGILGLEKNEGGETDGFVFTDINTVVNAFHYRALVLMSWIAGVAGHDEDGRFFRLQAEKLKKSFNRKLFDRKRGVYTDGAGTSHASLHANMFPLAFGLVPEKQVKGVLGFIRSRGMACSVYGAQFLLDALYEGGDAEYGLHLLSSTAERSWYNMIRAGSTVATEAWDNKYKPNQDWNHAWGAAPANLIPRRLMGIEPLEPGCGKIRIKPQPGSLQQAEIKHPTLRGDVKVSFVNDPGKSFVLTVEIPANTTAEIHLPWYSPEQTVRVNGNTASHVKSGNFTLFENVGPGKKIFEITR